MVLGGLFLYAAVASLTRPLTDAAVVAVAVPCLVVLVLAARGPSHHARAAGPRPGVGRATAAWAVVVVLAAAWELVAWLQQPAYDVASYDHPTISILLDEVTDPWAVRLAAWCCWLYVGYRLVRR